MSMLKLFRNSENENIETLYSRFPKCRFLVKLDSIESTSGNLIAVSDSVDTDSEIAQIMHKNLADGNLCLICGDYVHGDDDVIGSII